jgi:hypothetical protein
MTEDVRTDLLDLIKRFKNDPDKLAAALIEIVGSKDEAYRRIDAASVRGSPGRPKKYFEADAQVMFEVERLENEYRHTGRKVPRRRALIKKIVSTELANGKHQLGKTADVATLRIKSLNPSLIEMLFKAMRKRRPDLAQHLPPDIDERLRELDPNSFSTILELLLILAAFQQKYPDVIERGQPAALAVDEAAEGRSSKK